MFGSDTAENLLTLPSKMVKKAYPRQRLDSTVWLSGSQGEEYSHKLKTGCSGLGANHQAHTAISGIQLNSKK